MSHQLPPVSVYKYDNVEGLISLVQFKTNCTRAEIANKRQFSYLTGYLASDHIMASTMVVEDSYTDRHYLEDYTAYYARCFNNYPKLCTRVHFFSEPFTEEEFLAALISNKERFLKRLESSYVGYVVIKPLSNAFLGGIYLKPYPGLCKSTSHKVIRRDHFATLAGIRLRVETVAFTEQDQVVSACATSALWSYLSAYDNYISMSLPSPSAITQSATGENIDGTRNFPSEGLTDTQILRSIKHFGYEPTSVPVGKSSFPKHNSSLLKECVYAYVNDDVPVLVAGMIFQKCEDGTNNFKLAGPHLVCMLGYHLREGASTGTADVGAMQLDATRIDKYYVHDDRVGPYARFGEDTSFTVLHDGQSYSATGLELSILTGETKEYFYPVEIYLGVYHKIRLTYQDVKSVCRSIFDYVAQIHRTVSASQSVDTVEGKALLEITNALQNASLSIQLSTTNKIKQGILKSTPKFFSFNGIAGPDGKAEFVQRNQPKYLWQCRVTINTEKFLDVLLDATEIPSGNLLVGYMAYSRDAQELWTILSVDAKDYLHGTSPKQSGFYEDQNNLRLIKLLQMTEGQSYLNTIFGPIRLPQRKLKPGELNGIQNIPLRTDLKLIKFGNKHGIKQLGLEKIDNKKYIWVVNEDGDFVYGEDVEKKDEEMESYSGHPTLEMNKPARLGGELLLIKDDRLEINLHSRNYSKHITQRRNRKLYLENVVKHFFKNPNHIRIDSAVTRS